MNGVNEQFRALLERVRQQPDIALPRERFDLRRHGAPPPAADPRGVVAFPEAMFFGGSEYITVYVDFFGSAYPGSPVVLDPVSGQLSRTTPPHRHDFFELAYLYAGSMQGQVEGHDFAMRPGQLCLYNQRAAHSFTMLGPDTILVNVLVRRAAFERMILPIACRSSLYSTLLESLSDLSGRALCLQLDVPEDSDAQGLLLRLLEEQIRRDDHSGQIMLFTLLTLLSEIGRIRSEDLLSPEPPSAPERLDAREILNYIRGFYDEATLESAARYLNYSKEYISRTLQAQTGRSFSDWRQEYRLEVARMRLGQPSLSVESIARSLGYSERRTFDRMFKQRYGITPARYRSSMSAANGEG